ncbi:MAG: rhamnulokinase family protein [Candidatus Bathyarchaeia archaeon]
MPTFLAIDIGAESGRGVVVNYDGDRIILDEALRFPNGPINVRGRLYWDVLKIWSELKAALTKAYRNMGEGLVSLGVDTWGVDFALLDKNDELVCNPRHYRDPRTEGMMEEAFKLVSKEEIYSRTGIQFMRLNTLYQLLATVRESSTQLEVTRSLLMMPDLFNFWFCGKKVCEFTDATTTQFFNPFEDDWDRDLLRKLGIPTHFLLEVVQPGTTLGPLDHTIAKELNVGVDIEVVATTSHDTASAVAASPLGGEDDAYISSGTWSLVGMEVSRPFVDNKTLYSNFTNEGGAFGTFRLLKNVQGLWLLEESRRVWGRMGKQYTYDQIIDMARSSYPFKFVIDVDEGRFTVPTDMPTAIAEYCVQTGQGAPANDAEVVRCIFDSLALKYRITISKLESITGRRINEIHVVGGGSRNALLNQLVSDATGRRVVAGPAEATSVGNALMQCAALGFIRSSSQLRDIVRRSFELKVFEPQREYAQAWDEFQIRFEKIQTRDFL